MPRRNPSRIIVEQCHRFKIRDLVIKHGLIRPGQTTAFHIHPLPFLFRGFLSADWNSGWIEIAGGVGTRWEIRRRATHLKHCWDDEHFFLIGHTDKHPCRELLLTKDLKLAGTRLDLKAHHRSTHIHTRKRTIKRRELIFAQLLIHSCRPDDLTRCFVPIDGGGGLVDELEPKEKGGWWSAFWQRWKRANPYPALPITAVRRPIGMSTPQFYRALNKLNAHHIRAGRVRALVFVKSRGGDVGGSKAIADLNSIFGRLKARG